MIRKTIRKFVIVAAVIVGTAAFFSENAPDVPTVAHASTDEWKDAALTDIRAEKMVAEAMFPAPRSLWISVKDDGMPRDGLAEYFCTSLVFAGKPNNVTVTVRILDVADLNRTLGKAFCE